MKSRSRCTVLKLMPNPAALVVQFGYPLGAKLIKLVATCGPRDIDDPRPAITVMLPDED